ncbi:MAG: PASTA domain-containing protein [Kofleriaceae bacterium]
MKAFVLLLLWAGLATAGDQVTMPKLLGMTMDQAKAELKKLGFVYEVATTDANLCTDDRSPANDGKVVCQEPDAGTKTHIHQLVTIGVFHVDKHEGRITKEQLVTLEGKTIADATAALKKMGFLGSVSLSIPTQFIKGCRAGTVCEVSEGGASTTDSAEVVHFMVNKEGTTISTSENTNRIKMPNVIGMTRDKAFALVSQAGFKIIEQDDARSGCASPEQLVPANDHKVLCQTPNADTSDDRENQSRVTLGVYLQAGRTLMQKDLDPMVGKPIEEAKTMLRKIGYLGKFELKTEGFIKGCAVGIVCRIDGGKVTTTSSLEKVQFVVNQSAAISLPDQ